MSEGIWKVLFMENSLKEKQCHPTFGNISRENYNPKTYMHSSVQCNTIYNIWDQEAPKYSSIDEWIKKIWLCYLAASRVQIFWEPMDL